MIKIYVKNASLLIWCGTVSYCIFNCSNTISVGVILGSLLAVLIYNFILYRDFDIFKNDLDRSILFIEKRLNEIKTEKIKNNNEKN